ncbi:MAG TPA: MFS transporter [Candidatus Syntrophoarchaeum butanivorans]|uniref:MFS transporter n=2 Tax=Candidatus Syntropharchaeum butanivorans TaxID=1839936 RepID=A0A1F2P2T5_9EURY|nr:MAG: MFS transporter [Candidatus Syntrophoarchaeum butanivorans]HEC56941.1 MFS transporter [Candidatus Syntrophoarchaeum butanivorans]
MKEEGMVHLLALTVFIAMVGVGIIAPIIPIYAERLGATGLWIGFIYAGFAISRAIFMPLIGELSDRRGRKFFITIGLLLYSIISLGYVYSTTVVELASVRFISGLGSAMVTPVAFAYAAEIAPLRGEGRVLGEVGMALSVGIGIGVFLGGVLSDRFGIAVPFYTMGTLSCLTLILVIWSFPSEENPVFRSHVGGGRVNLGHILGYDLVKGVSAFRFVNSFSIGAIMSFLPIFATRLDITPTGIGILLSVNIMLAGILQPYFGRFADRINRVWLIFSGSILTTIALLLIPYTGSFRGLLLLNLLMGAGGAIAVPASLAMMADVGRDDGMGALMGIYNAAMSMGMATGPIISGIIMDIMGIQEVFTLAGMISLIGSLYFLRRVG